MTTGTDEKWARGVSPGGAKFRAMATLAWPIVLTKPRPERDADHRRRDDGVAGSRCRWPAGTLGFNIYFTPMIFGMACSWPSRPWSLSSSAGAPIPSATCDARCARGCGSPSCWRSRSGR